MDWYVCRNHNLARDLMVMQYTYQLRARTQAVVDTLRQLRRQFHAGRPTAAGGRRLPALLDTYTEYIRFFVPEAASLTHPSRLGELVGWAGELSLEAVPVEVSTAHLMHLERRVRQYETEALQAQAAKVGDYGDYISRTHPIAIPTSETVAPGGIYEAQLFLTSWERSAAYCTEKFSANNIELRERSQLADNWLFGWNMWANSRQYTHRIPPARPGQPDTVPAHWQGTIEATGYIRDTVLTVRVPYRIVKRPAR